MTKPLSWGQLLAILVATCQDLPDQRTGKNSQYTLSDAALGALRSLLHRNALILSPPKTLTCNAGKGATMPRVSSASPIFPVIRRFAISGSNCAGTSAATLLDGARAVSASRRVEGLPELHRRFALLPGRHAVLLFDADSLSAVYRYRERRPAPAMLIRCSIPALVRPGKAEVLVMEPEFHHAPRWRREQDCERNAARRGSNAIKRCGWRPSG